ncbi:MAG: ATP-dependent sacrificial sulfur transferase LarE [Proteobacteria bacterium]|nr:ATP-dependent sacrificial sulfur transferase LarE [Pseudomonadota bacterium]MBU1738743.1 ATP-dependent sacrificial sulfur transferase LarE [Pseudomonadota bacterium]
MSFPGKYEQLLAIVNRSPGAVAFSGGVDSSLVLRAAVDVFGSATVAFFADSVLQPPGEIENVKMIADLIGCELRIIPADPLSWPEFVANPTERCYLCKKKIYSLFLDSLADTGRVLMDGSNLDDLGDDRPGRKAVMELDVKTPLIEAGIGKDMVRQICRDLGLPNWNKISASCLATRFPAGMTITGEKLDRVALYESEMHKLGFHGCRVRLVAGSGREVRVEVMHDDLEKLGAPILRKNILQKLLRIGAGKVCFDPNGR